MEYVNFLAEPYWCDGNYSLASVDALAFRNTGVSPLRKTVKLSCSVLGTVKGRLKPAKMALRGANEKMSRSGREGSCGVEVMVAVKVYRVSPLRPYRPVTVASFRTWRGWREYVAWDPARVLV